MAVAETSIKAQSVTFVFQFQFELLFKPFDFYTGARVVPLFSLS